MNVHGTPYRTIWLNPQNSAIIQIIDQRLLPHEFKIVDLTTVTDVVHAIKAMLVRGAGLIGATAGYGMVLAALEAPQANREVFLEAVTAAGDLLCATRPTAVNLAYAVQRQLAAIRTGTTIPAMIDNAYHTAALIADEDAAFCRQIGEHGIALIEKIYAENGNQTVNILTHCNAGWLAFVDYGSATAPIYAAHDKGIPLHVWVDETRPRNQGARLTAWELGQHGVPHTIIADNVGGHLMQHGKVDLVITGADRVTRSGDAANKIGTYLKALAAQDNQVPFYVALPSSTFDFALRDGVKQIPIEERGADEVTFMQGVLPDGTSATIRITPADSPAANYGFDVTPARLITGLITERGICAATESAITELYADKVI